MTGFQADVTTGGCIPQNTWGNNSLLQVYIRPGVQLKAASNQSCCMLKNVQYIQQHTRHQFAALAHQMCRRAPPSAYSDSQLDSACLSPEVVHHQASDGMICHNATVVHRLSGDRRCAVLLQPVLNGRALIGVPISSNYWIHHCLLQSCIHCIILLTA